MQEDEDTLARHGLNQPSQPALSFLAPSQPAASASPSIYPRCFCFSGSPLTTCYRAYVGSAVHLPLHRETACCCSIVSATCSGASHV
ncbi:hypothetical protein ZWY2020_026435 [Hordeum vulgare]|nr:hypothetical protein ZWY2020_026435 [Hordeum vulgare]